MSTIAALLQAAEYLDRREREAEHGYASTMPMPDDLIRRRPKSKKPQGSRLLTNPRADICSKEIGFKHRNADYRLCQAASVGESNCRPCAWPSRTTHNELEKNRRAHLRNCLERLKEMVPLGPESSRHTTLGLLTKAKAFIKNLEDKERRHANQKEALFREQRYLRRRLDQLNTNIDSLHKRRSVSESSNSTYSSTTSSTSETDEVDILGYNSNQSDTDDHSSIQSLNSDGGLAISTKRLMQLGVNP